MGKRQKKPKATWVDVKAKLTSFDRAALLSLIQNLYASDHGNRAFLHARFGLGDDPLCPYKNTIDRWLWPDAFRGQQPSVSKAKEAITQYQKALGDPVGLAELLVFYCERAAGFCREVDYRDTAYLDALLRTFDQALKATGKLSGKVRKTFLSRLDDVKTIGYRLAYGVGDEMDVLFSELASTDFEC
jgi:hypothetical protein